MAVATPKIKLYTNHACPWAHRAHIALAELQVPFEEEIIDLSVPRTAEYLKINPRGQVPSINFNGEILAESAIIANFLADAFPSHLLPAAGSPEAALLRARTAFFVDTFISKINGNLYKAQSAPTDAEADEWIAKYVDGIVKEIEPQLANAAPFFNGSSKLTQAEVLTGSFIIRLFALLKHGVLPESVANDLSTKAPNFYKWGQAVANHPSVSGIFPEDRVVAFTKNAIAKARGN